jgi:hypothetical protein
MLFPLWLMHKYEYFGERLIQFWFKTAVNERSMATLKSTDLNFERRCGQVHKFLKVLISIAMIHIEMSLPAGTHYLIDDMSIHCWVPTSIPAQIDSMAYSHGILQRIGYI